MDLYKSHFLGDFGQIPGKLIIFDVFQLIRIGQSLNQDHGNIFRQDPKPFVLQTHKFLVGTGQNHLLEKSENVKLSGYQYFGVSLLFSSKGAGLN